MFIKSLRYMFIKSNICIKQPCPAATRAPRAHVNVGESILGDAHVALPPDHVAIQTDMLVSHRVFILSVHRLLSG